ncbi:hypothetical protein C8J56DRAFT_1054399 [Mycena floridula]|nr:hypothetical protein C8J56DRAFT_1054399 [Mycena floridula]
MTPTHIKLETITEAGAITAKMLRDIGDITQIMQLKGIAGMGPLIFEAAQIVKSNKDESNLATYFEVGQHSTDNLSVLGGPLVIVLDNIQTPWEPRET